LISSNGERLDLPGPRWAWALLAAAALALPLALHAGSGAPSAKREVAGLDVEIRYRNVAWLLARQAQRDFSAREREVQREAPATLATPTTLARATTLTDRDDDRATIGRPRLPLDKGDKGDKGDSGDKTRVAPKSTASRADAAGAAGSGAGNAATVGEGTDGVMPIFAAALKQTLDGLFTRAQAIAARNPAEAQAALEMTIAHAIATDDAAAAHDTLVALGRPSDDLRAALSTVPAGTKLPTTAVAMSPADAAAQMAPAAFGGGWSPFVRARLRARIAAIVDDRVMLRRENGRVHAIEDRVYETLTSIVQVGVMALFVGLGVWLYLLLRAFMPGSGGRLSWLTARFAGPDPSSPWPTDKLVPLLGVATWVAGYHAAALLMALMPSARPTSGLAVLFQTLAGLVVAMVVAAAFGRGRTPFESVAMVDPRAEGSGLRAATWSLLAFFLLLPVMLLAVVFSEVVQQIIGSDPAQVHLAVQLMIGEADAIQILAIVLATVVAAPLAEEVIFRGFLYRALRDSWGRTPAVIVSALAFAALHMAFPVMIPLLVLGLAFALVFEWTGSLWASITMHALWNAFIVAASLVITQT
jgi:membrane protease YdiL (CAAX protease family)